MELAKMTTDEIREKTLSTEDKEEVREIAKFLEISFSGNTGVDTLKNKIMEVLATDPDLGNTGPDPNDPIMKALQEKKAEVSQPTRRDPNALPSQTVLKTLNPRDPKYNQIWKRAIVRAKALELKRVRVTNLDPDDAALPAMLLTAYNKYTGKVSKLIPFGEENNKGYHLPMILIKELQSRTFNMRKEVRGRGQSFGVKEYKTVQMKKFNIEFLPDLTEQEIQDLARDQAARGAIDTAA